LRLGLLTGWFVDSARLRLVARLPTLESAS
jgi:hypothetical protein